MRYVHGFFLLVFLAALGVFALQNNQSVVVRFVNWESRIPVALGALVVYVLGMLSGWNVVGFVRRSLSRVTAESRSR